MPDETILSLDDQIALFDRTSDNKFLSLPIMTAILASLRKLKRIEDMKDVPEPVAVVNHVTSAEHDLVIGTPLYGPEVLDLLAAEKVRADEAEAGINKLLTRHKSIVFDADERYTELLHQSNICLQRAELAESRLAKVMEALREPTEEMIEAMMHCLDGVDLRKHGATYAEQKRYKYLARAKAMSSVLLSELSKDADKNSI